jgi:hypothetical protein
MNSTSILRASSLYACCLLLALNGCGAKTSDVPGDPVAPVKVDAGDTGSVPSRSVDAAAPLSSVSQSSPSSTSSGAPSMATPSGAVMTTAPSMATTSMATASIATTSITTTSMTMPMTTDTTTAMTTATGSASTGSPSEVPGSSLAGQSNCEGSFSSNTPTFTYYDLVCDPDTLWANCSLDATEITCVCGNRTTLEMRFYTLPLGTDLETASRAGIPLCNDQSALSAVDVQCEDTQPTSDTECSLRTTCTNVFDLGDGVQAFEETTRYPLYCTALGPTASECTCSNPFQNMTVHGVGTAEACAAAAPVCDSEVPLEEEISCTGFELSLDPGTCNATRRCGYRADLDEAGDVFALTSPFPRAAYCDEDGAGSSQCYCFAEEMNPFLSGSVLSDADTACLVADDVCYSGAPLHVNGAMECGSLSAVEVYGACSASTTCVQEFSNGTSSIQRSADMFAGCQPAGNGGWSCTCSSAFEQTLPEIITAPDAVAACTQAIEDCSPRGHLEITDSQGVAVVFSAAPGEL